MTGEEFDRESVKLFEKARLLSGHEVFDYSLYISSPEVDRSIEYIEDHPLTETYEQGYNYF